MRYYSHARVAKMEIYVRGFSVAVKESNHYFAGGENQEVLVLSLHHIKSYIPIWWPWSLSVKSQILDILYYLAHSPRVPDVRAIGPVELCLLAAPGDVVRVTVHRAVHEPVGSGQHPQIVVKVVRRAIKEHEQATF